MDKIIPMNKLLQSKKGLVSNHLNSPLEVNLKKRPEIRYKMLI